MDIVIPFKKDTHGTLELIYALRSAEKFLSIGQVWVIGDKTGLNVNHIECPDIRERKEYSIAFKIHRACLDEKVSDPFIVWHDDHFMLKESEIIPWHCGSMERMLKLARGGYYTAIVNTIAKGCQVNFDVHTPFVVEKERFKEVFKSIDNECLIKSMYFKEGGEYMEDCKINYPLTKQRIYEKIKGRIFFSTGPVGMGPEMVEVLQELYPNPSKYERTTN
jgi:hypothetical protein